VPKGSKRSSKSKLKIVWRVLKKASKMKFAQQRRKLPRSTSALSRRSRRPRRRLPKPPPRLRREPKKPKTESISLIWIRSKISLRRSTIWRSLRF